MPAKDEIKDNTNAIVSTRLNIVRGSPNKDNMTKLWLKVRKHSGDDRSAMRVLGITSDRQLNSVVRIKNRQVETATLGADHVKAAINRAKQVEDLSMVIRAIIGDGGSTGEFDYLTFQIRGSQIALVRVDKEEYEQLVDLIAGLRDAGLNIGSAFINSLDEYLDGDGIAEMIAKANLEEPDSEESLEQMQIL